MTGSRMATGIVVTGAKEELERQREQEGRLRARESDLLNALGSRKPSGTSWWIA